MLCLGIASARAQTLTAALGVSATGELSRYFASGLAKHIASSGQRIEAGKTVRKQAAILMIDIRGFTEFAASAGPEEVLAVLSHVQSRAIEIVSRHGGAIDKFLGDGILATFGCVHPLELPTASALRAASDLVASVARWNDGRKVVGDNTILVGTAVSSGDVLFGTVGFGDRLEFTVFGDPLNRAAKFEKYNKTAGTTLITDAKTFAAARREGFNGQPVKRLRARKVAGILRPVEVVVLS